MRRSPRDVSLDPAFIAGRVPPHDLDAEAAVLSAILLAWQETLVRVADVLKPEHFYSDANGRIFEAMIQLSLVGTPIDIVSVASYLRDRERLAQVGGPTYLGQLADATPAVAHVESHARIVLNKWLVRAAIATCQRIAAEGYGDVGDPREFVRAARTALALLADIGQSHTDEHILPILQRVMNNVVELAEKGKRTLGVPTGYIGIDKATGGLHPGRVMYIAARPGVGKSSLVRNIATNVLAVENVEYGVIVIQLEGTKAEVGSGILCAEAQVDGLKFAAGVVQTDDWRKLTDCATWLSQRPLWVEDRSCTVDDIIAIVRRKKEEFDRPASEGKLERRVHLVIIDYVQRVKATSERMKRSDELAIISGRIKEDLAKGCNVAVVALAAMNREVEKRKGGKPQLSDIRDCGDLESDADQVLFLDRQIADDDDGGGERRAQPGETKRSPTIATAQFGKNRFGPASVFKLRFFPPSARFVDLYEGEEP